MGRSNRIIKQEHQDNLKGSRKSLEKIMSLCFQTGGCKINLVNQVE